MGTAFVTVVTGTVVFVMGQIVLKLLIEPIQEHRRAVADVHTCLLVHAASYANPPVPEEKYEETYKALRGCAGRLHASLVVVPFCDTLARLRLVRRREAVVNARTKLIGVSNGLSHKQVAGENSRWADDIVTILGLPPLH